METKRTWLKQYRHLKGYNQDQVARQVDIKRSYYNMIENGKRNPSTKVAKNIADYLQFDWTIFFEHECNDVKQNVL
ncbi:putative HTH-type transcriptional regulator YqaF [Lentibacillus sp. JNUCC-1]|uniref:helix-turn-helix transcriptional regulator n=1 Tax=Lentibacillus sp. JNUCC-1 TaxID=2654513 RepID=UPI001323FFF4|nr:putative HTH-type transcriptional regulator YqaF [Lentibacillus sp. JNUCC-1]MUV38401.1 putative HTH-type transcriptional regulator YqaF [Lentibacillus sp. JNUCC-1]